jgi:hypothetical protein
MRRIKILIIGHCHPDLPHVCALRTRGFADGLARRGHEIVLLTGALSDTRSTLSVENIMSNLSQGLGNDPLVISCLPQRHGWLRRAREGQFPSALNKALLAGGFLIHSGLFNDWVEGSKIYWPILAKQWRPDVVWATFGNTGAWLIAQGIAGRAGCPWIMDMKDPWADFIPSQVRRLLAARFNDFAASTALADIHATDIRHWFGGDPIIVPSGVDIPISPRGYDIDPATEEPDNGALRISLVGSLYDETDLKAFLAGLHAWGKDRRRRSVRPAILEYFGGEKDRLLAATRSWGDICEVRTSGFIAPAKLARRLRQSNINAFVNARSGFRHKVLEFVVAGRPILCLPGLAADETQIIKEAGVRFYNCATSKDVKKALDDFDKIGDPDTAMFPDVDQFSWDARVSQLEAVFEQVLR